MVRFVACVEFGELDGVVFELAMDFSRAKATNPGESDDREESGGSPGIRRSSRPLCAESSRKLGKGRKGKIVIGAQMNTDPEM